MRVFVSKGIQRRGKAGLEAVGNRLIVAAGRDRQKAVARLKRHQLGHRAIQSGLGLRGET